MDAHITVERGSNGVLSLVMARPERRNAITVAMYAAMADAIESAASDPGVRLITLEGEGQDFTAGNDLGDFRKEMPFPGSDEDLPVWRLLRALAKNETPVVAAVQGNAVGIGTTMLLHCDFVIIEQGSRLVMPFVDLGLVPEAASSLLLPRLVGRPNAARFLLLGEAFNADEAYALGLASHTAAKGSLQETLRSVVERLLAKPPEALRQTQRLLRRQSADDILDRIELENSEFANRLRSTEAKEAIAHFFDAKSSKPVPD
jgi:enoyl-CoA hydratase/carnithine racemase